MKDLSESCTVLLLLAFLLLLLLVMVVVAAMLIPGRGEMNKKRRNLMSPMLQQLLYIIQLMKVVGGASWEGLVHLLTLDKDVRGITSARFIIGPLSGLSIQLLAICWSMATLVKRGSWAMPMAVADEVSLRQTIIYTSATATSPDPLLTSGGIST